MNKKEEEEIKRLREAYDRVKDKRESNGFAIHHRLRTPLIWTLFFSIVGIIQKSIVEGRFVFIEFFSSGYLAWFRSFGNFSENYLVSGYMDVVYLIIKDWYYFFLTGGLISLIWALLYVLVNHRFEHKKDDFNLYVDNKLSK